MMANSARDPYWQAAVRREIMDHPESREAIEDACSICHMPMTTYPARAAGGLGRVFDHLPPGRPDDPDAVLAADGVSCTVCHQIQPAKFGDPSSFTGGYVIDVAPAGGVPKVFGPFAIDAGRTKVMQSSSGFTHPAVRTVRHLPHLVHPFTGARCQRRDSAGADAVSGVAAERVP
jgi:hypothetical protein